jgi:hypothetical protein
MIKRDKQCGTDAISAMSAIEAMAVVCRRGENIAFRLGCLERIQMSITADLYIRLMQTEMCSQCKTHDLYVTIQP